MHSLMLKSFDEFEETNKYDADRAGWDNAVAGLQIMISCPRGGGAYTPKCCLNHHHYQHLPKIAILITTKLITISSTFSLQSLLLSLLRYLLTSAITIHIHYFESTISTIPKFLWRFYLAGEGNPNEASSTTLAVTSTHLLRLLRSTRKARQAK